ncbi:Type 1 glutamine amidotransferase-like domain-containing protein [Nocardioides sp. GY 10127]|uniref:Type 1 glutamine amidotransferase-like domain-containing protein n=1 Tax=Nocardioides sp. GY 10127 TaxID=2569762 RepID=UPI0010A8F934|nr:Type 1 glutamine amidotransferase-like domain-containing protein [Nocardioides sp. GY 10127]TIC85698.1 peptidase E [Nocardioides sp. GY 10127]
MKMLLTSGGIANEAIASALEELLGKPVGEARAILVPTALHALSQGVAETGRVVRGQSGAPLAEVGWAEVGVLELTALPLLDESVWRPALEQADALLVAGGDPLFLHHAMLASGLDALLPSLDLVYVGLSAGSMVVTPSIGADFVGWTPPGAEASTPGVDRTLGLVGFSLFPHLDNPHLPENTLTTAEAWAAGLGHRSYLLDDASAVVVVDGEERVVSRGQWHRRG